MNIFLTGATGFIGKAVLEELLETENKVTVAVRKKTDSLPGFVVQAKFDDGTFELSDTDVLNDIDVMIHCAGLAHVGKKSRKNTLSEYRKVNVDLALSFARTAANKGVKRFVFLSSIGVNGSISLVPFKETDTPAPDQLYAVSKLEAEEGLRKIASETGMELVIIRPPLVYGPNAPGNFATLIKYAYKNLPLPLASINNKRSFISIDNLVDFIICCAKHPSELNQLFLVADNESFSTTELFKYISNGLGKKPRLFSINQGIVEFVLKILGLKSIAQSLYGTLLIDNSKAKNILNWTPPFSITDGLDKTINSFLQHRLNE